MEKSRLYRWNNIINKIIVKLRDVYELMDADDSKIDGIKLVDFDLTKGIQNILKKFIFNIWNTK